MGLKIENSLNNFYALPEENTAPIGGNKNSYKTQNSSTASNKAKLPPITGSVEFTALGCDTERKLAQAAYMAAASKAGIASDSAQRDFADQMIARHSSQLAILGKKEISLDDAKVKDSLNNRSVSFELSSEEKAELAEFRKNYAAAGGKIRFSQKPTVDLREPGAVGGATDSPKAANPKFQVLLNNTGNPTDAKRVLAQYAEDSYKGGNLWGQNYGQIGEMSAAQGVKPKITGIKHVGNKVSVEFELTPLDRAKVHENYKTVQAEVNRAVAVYEDFANNNEVSSFLRGVFNGAVKSVKGTIGLLNLPETMKALWQVVAHPVETFNALSKELSDTWEEFKNAPANKKSEMVGELVGQAIVEILIGKGIGKAGSILAKTKTGAEILEKTKLLKTATVAKVAEAFSDEAAQIAKQSAKSRLRQMGSQLNSGLPVDPLLLRDLTIVAGNKVKNGSIKFVDFSKQMIDEFGENIKPHLEKLYSDVMEKFGKFVDRNEIKSLNLNEIKTDIDAITSPPKAKRNARLGGNNHPATDVPFDRNSYPIFNSKKDVTLPKNLRGNAVSDVEQFKYATKQLHQTLEKYPDLKNGFTKKQLQDIEAGQPYIDGLTWHHHQDGIRLQLVDRDIHAKTGHDGGRKNTGGRP